MKMNGLFLVNVSLKKHLRIMEAGLEELAKRAESRDDEVPIWIQEELKAVRKLRQKIRKIRRKMKRFPQRNAE